MTISGQRNGHHCFTAFAADNFVRNKMKNPVRKKILRHQNEGVPVLLATLIILFFLFTIFYLVLHNPFF